MKHKSLKSFTAMCLLSIQLLNFSSAFAKSGGSMDGGGGDASEERVNEIRSDILKWIRNNGALDLKLPEDLPYSLYVSKMVEILEPQKVIIGFVDQDDQYNEELKVTVSGAPKTCRGFISKQDLQPHVLCNISRFKNTPEAEQYRLIHHEYAGLTRIEKNLGASSDYTISSQITDYLTEQKVLKLAVKKVDSKANSPYAIKCAYGEAEKLSILKGGPGWKYTNKLFNLIYDTQEDVFVGRITDNNYDIREFAEVKISLTKGWIMLNAFKDNGYINSSIQLPGREEAANVSGKMNKKDFFGIECVNTNKDYKPFLFNF